MTYKNQEQEIDGNVAIRIVVNPEPSYRNIFKTWVWNLILPPHVRLYIPVYDEESEDD